MTGSHDSSHDSAATEPEILWLEVGTIGKAHGLKGEVVVDFVTDRVDERTAVGSEFRLGERTLVVKSARPHQQKWLIYFDGVSDRTDAERLRGGVLEAEAVDDPDALFVHDLIGKVVVDQYGTRHGNVVAVVENPASDLLELEDGRLVPLVFVVDDDGEPEPGVVRVSVPPGLLDDDTLS